MSDPLDQKQTFERGPMTEAHSRHKGPLLVALAIAIFGVLAMLIVDHGPWSPPRVETAEVADHGTTGQAARSAGAAVQQTPPRPALEPQAPGPKPAQPADPE
jgi:hypothetical protein